MNIPWRKRKIRTCIVLGNPLFSIWQGIGHPVRYMMELDMILNTGFLSVRSSKWSLWEKEKYRHSDLIDFLDQTGKFIRLMNDTMDLYDEVYKSRDYNIKKKHIL